MDWNDFRLILAISRAQGLPGAAKELGVTLSTVFRRLEKLEDQLSKSLFTKIRQAYVPTEIGMEMVRTAERIEVEVLAGERAVSGQDQQLTGSLRVTTSEVFATFFLARHLPQFHNRYPQLKIEVLSGNELFSLAGRKADVALRPVRPADESLVGRKIADIPWGIYRSRQYAEMADRHTMNSDPPAFIGFTSETEEIQRTLVNRAEPEGVDIRGRSNSLVTNAALAQAGMGDALLPCILGESWPGLRCIKMPVQEVAGELWIVCHRDLYGNARVRALFDFVIEVSKTDTMLKIARS